jgi:hypothetical protein
VRSFHGNAGFFAILTFVLNQLRYCEKHRYFPVVYLGEKIEGTGDFNAFYDAKAGDNVWEYYFEPVLEPGYSEILKMVEDPAHPLFEQELLSLSNKHLWYLHQHDSKSIYAYNYGYYKRKEKYDAGWYAENRNRAHRLLEKYVQVKQPILKEIEDYYEEHMRGKNVIGVHMRGTDKGSAHATEKTMRIVTPEEYVPHIDAYLKEHSGSMVFLATDQQQFLVDLKKRYGDQLLSYDAVRSDGNLAPFQMKDGKNFKKGKDVLIDCLLLSRCQFLLKCTSHVGEAVLWFRPDLSHRDLNHDSPC